MNKTNNNCITENIQEKIILDGTKVKWHTDRISAWLNNERIAPVTIDLALTQSCNWRCEYCFKKLQYNKPRVLTKKILFQFLDDCAEIGVKALSFTGDGESTCSPVYVDSILKGRQNGINISSATHGGNFTKEILKEILPCLTYLRFNISAGEPSRYAQIHGVDEESYHRVIENIKTAVTIKKKYSYAVTIGLQMVFQEKYADQLIPLATLGKKLGVDYLVIKHTADDMDSTLDIDYRSYKKLYSLLKEVEKYNTSDYLVTVKWNKIKMGNKREYTKCYGPPFIMQISGSGLVAPCAIMLNDKYSDYHIGNISDTPFLKLWQSDRYLNIMNQLKSNSFDARHMCALLCLQDMTNIYLWKLKNKKIELSSPQGEKPQHINFI